MSKGLGYISNIEKLIKEVKETQAAAMKQSAEIIAESLMSGGMIYAFGTGHSHMLAVELFYRAGGLARVYPILDEGLMLHRAAAKSTSSERMNGYAEALLNDYPVKEGDVIIIASNSGRNAVTIEMAIEAEKRGLKVLAVTSLKHSKSAASRHSNGKRLFELADVVIDNCGCIGDASIEFEKIGSVGPTSTVIGVLILQSIICEAVEIMLDKNVKPEIYISSNVGDFDNNKELIEKYSKLIKCL